MLKAAELEWYPKMASWYRYQKITPVQESDFPVPKIYFLVTESAFMVPETDFMVQKSYFLFPENDFYDTEE